MIVGHRPARTRKHRDIRNPHRYVETYVVSSYTDHQRQLERQTVADRRALQYAWDLHAGSGDPQRQVMIVGKLQAAPCLSRRPTSAP